MISKKVAMATVARLNVLSAYTPENLLQQVLELSPSVALPKAGVALFVLDALPSSRQLLNGAAREELMLLRVVLEENLSSAAGHALMLMQLQSSGVPILLAEFHKIADNNDQGDGELLVCEALWSSGSGLLEHVVPYVWRMARPLSNAASLLIREIFQDLTESLNVVRKEHGF